jgi:hypothetical protein
LLIFKPSVPSAASSQILAVCRVLFFLAIVLNGLHKKGSLHPPTEHARLVGGGTVTSVNMPKYASVNMAFANENT